jgi:outer membrane protein assembly factor BamA
MNRVHQAFGALSLCFFAFANSLSAQSTETGTAALHEVHADGQKILTEPQIVALTGLQSGTQVGRADLQSAADKLVACGLFAKVNYNFQTKGDGVSVTFHVEEGPRLPAYFDNFPWFADSDLADAIRKKLPFFDGTLPEGGTVMDQATEAVNDVLTTRGLHVTLEHQVLANPDGEGNVQSFHVEGAGIKIAKLDFSDPSLANSKVVQQHLAEIIGKPYSRMTIDLFLSEQIRPIYQKLGLLRAKLGPPEVHLTGNPNQKLPEEIPVFVPINPGTVYHWKSAQWSGNTVLSTFTLDSFIGLKAGDVADGMHIEGAWDRAREEYGHHGYLDAKVDPVAQYDDQAHTVSYHVNIEEKAPYKFRNMVVTGLSRTAETRLRQVWPITAGQAFDKTQYEEILTKLQIHPAQVFGDLPIHYDTVGHWLQTEPTLGTVDVLLDFK